MGTTEAAKTWLQDKVATYSNKIKDARNSLSFDTTALNGIVVLDCSPGSISCLFPVTKQVCTVGGYLHGGCIGATLIMITVCTAFKFRHSGLCSTTDASECGPSNDYRLMIYIEPFIPHLTQALLWMLLAQRRLQQFQKVLGFLLT